MLVTDASVVLEWFLPGQLSTTAAAAQLLARKSILILPPIWPLEVQNVLLKKVRQKKLAMAEATEIRLQLSLMLKRIVNAQDKEHHDRIWNIAVKQMLTCYDASYLALAADLALPLATDDGAMRAAAIRMHVMLI